MKFNYLNDLSELREKLMKHEGFEEAIEKLLIWNTLNLSKLLKLKRLLSFKIPCFLEI